MEPYTEAVLLVVRILVVLVCKDLVDTLVVSLEVNIVVVVLLVVILSGSCRSEAAPLQPAEIQLAASDSNRGGLTSKGVVDRHPEVAAVEELAERESIEAYLYKYKCF